MIIRPDRCQRCHLDKICALEERTLDKSINCKDSFEEAADLPGNQPCFSLSQSTLALATVAVRPIELD